MEAEVFTIVEKHKRTLNSHDASTYTPADIRDNVGLNTHHYAFLKTEEYENGVYVDISTMMQEQVVGQTLTWEEFYEKLTPAMVDSYKIYDTAVTENENNINPNAGVIIHPLSTVGLDLSYCDRKDPTEVNIYHRRWDMPDLIISKKEAFIEDLKYVNLNNCIVSINGVISESYVYKDKLFITDGAKNLWSINKQTSPNITMMDTTYLGGMETIPLSKCNIVYTGKDGSYGEDVLYKNIKIQLPKGYSFNEYTPFLVLAGKCYFTDELNIVNENSFMFTPFKFNIGLNLLSISDAQADYLYYTESIRPKITPMQYIAGLGKTEMSEKYDKIILIKNSKIYIERNYMGNDLYWLTRTTLNNTGLIKRLSDNSWMDYTAIDFVRYDLYHNQIYPNNFIQLSTQDMSERQLAANTIRCKHLDDHFRWTRDSTYELIHITAGK